MWKYAQCFSYWQILPFNLVVSDAVQGSITLNLQDVPWDQALDLVLESKDLGKRLEGNVLRIAPAEHLRSARSMTLRLCVESWCRSITPRRYPSGCSSR